MRAEIIAVGTELLLGQTLNTNSSCIARRLAELGISVYRHTTVGDNRERIVAALREALENNDLVITTGGLGPTVDDLTKECVAQLLSVDMVQDEEALVTLRSFFAKRNWTMSENNLRQSCFPRHSVILRNDNGTAPGCIVPAGGEKAFVLLPGPPFEMEAMFEGPVLGWLSEKIDAVIRSRSLHMCGIGESEMETRARDIIDTSDNPTVAPYAKRGECFLRITARAATADECDRLIDPVAKQIYERLGGFIYGENTTIEEALVSALKKKNMTLALAESCTGGMVASRIVNVSGASDVFLHSCVVYSNEAKIALLGVASQTLDTYGAVSEQTVIEMASGARKICNADIAAAISGVAGPGGGTEEKPVGLVHFAFDVRGRLYTERLLMPGDRESIRLRSCVFVMATLIRLLNEV